MFCEPIIENELDKRIRWAIYEAIVLAGLRGAMLTDDEHAECMAHGYRVAREDERMLVHSLAEFIRDIDPYRPNA